MPLLVTSSNEKTENEIKNRLTSQFYPFDDFLWNKSKIQVQLLGNLQGKASQIPHLYLLSKVKLVKSTQDLFGKNQNQPKIDYFLDS